MTYMKLKQKMYLKVSWDKLIAFSKLLLSILFMIVSSISLETI